MKNSFLLTGILFILQGIDLLFHLTDHPKGSKLYFNGNGSIYFGLFFILLGIFFIFNRVKK